ncbi:MAG: MFS transporter, partial [Desulfobacterales bacterium]
MNPNPSPVPAAQSRADFQKHPVPAHGIDRKSRLLVIAAALMALFLGALDALVMSAAMPTIVADLGGLQLYSWVYSAYLLARAVSLPIFGKLADLFRIKTLFIISITLFLLASVLAGFSRNMTLLIIFRVFQGIGAGGNFALVYIVLADISTPANRGKTLSLGSFIWGIASVLGPTLGGFIVTYFSWRWIFFINVPLALFSLLGIAFYLIETRVKKPEVFIDYVGAITLSMTILALLTAFLLGGQKFAWTSPPMIGLSLLTAGSALAFYWAEKRARDPVLALRFFAVRGFSIGNGSVFLSSFAIFSLFAFAPLFIQGALGKNPMQVGAAMLALSLGWSLGSLLLGQVVNRFGPKPSAIWGALFLVIGCGLTLTFSSTTSMLACFNVFSLVGLGMGFVTLATLLVVQNSLDNTELGVATASHQFARTLGGTIGIGICGSFLSAKTSRILEAILHSDLQRDLDPSLALQIQQNFENLFRPAIQAQLPAGLQKLLQEA